MDTTTLGDRIKNYENSCDTNIIGRLPIIIRADGKNFSRWTKAAKFVKPFDKDLLEAMAHAMRTTAEKIDGCKFAFTQSDEITFVLRNDQSLESTPWFGNRVQKICSVVASMISVHFNRWYGTALAPDYFDTRVFAVPNITEAINSIVWRQNDAVKNSVSAACYYEVAKVTGKKTARKLMHKLNRKQQQELLFKQTGINWNDYPIKFKRGVGCSRVERIVTINGEDCQRSAWEVEYELPTFAKEQQYLKDILRVEEE